MPDITCIHADAGLCDLCQAAYDEDSIAWMEFGPHSAGIANWQALRDEMADEAARDRAAEAARAAEGVPEMDSEIPF